MFRLWQLTVLARCLLVRGQTAQSAAEKTLADLRDQLDRVESILANGERAEEPSRRPAVGDGEASKSAANAGASAQNGPVPAQPTIPGKAPSPQGCVPETSDANISTGTRHSRPKHDAPNLESYRSQVINAVWSYPLQAVPEAMYLMALCLKLVSTAPASTIAIDAGDLEILDFEAPGDKARERLPYVFRAANKARSCCIASGYTKKAI